MDIKNQHHLFTSKEKLYSFLLIQSTIIEKQKKNTPFFIGRLSGNETKFCGNVINNLNIPKELFQNMLFGAGIQFKSNKDIINYVKYYNNAISNSDLLGVWDSSMYSQAKPYYNYIYKTYPKLKKICASGLEPYYYITHPKYNFNTIFNNKRILIISSHKETINYQLKTNNIKYCFNKPIFHDSSIFYIYKPPQQNGGSHDNNSWIFHFEKMKKEILEIKKEFNFDIALVSCGGFGMIICDYIYTELKSSVIYIGGALQLFFGIIGQRWITLPEISKLINKYWTNVIDCDKPLNTKLCENSCYW